MIKLQYRIYRESHCESRCMKLRSIAMANEISSDIWPFPHNVLPQIFNFWDLLRDTHMLNYRNCFLHIDPNSLLSDGLLEFIQTSSALQTTRNSEASFFCQGYTQPTLYNRFSQPYSLRHQTDIFSVSEQYYRFDGEVVGLIFSIFFWRI